MQYVICAMLAYSLIGAFLTGFFDWEDDTLIVAIAPVVAIIVPFVALVMLGEWLREKMKGR